MTLDPTNPMRRALLGLLCFEVISFALALPIMLVVQHLSPVVAWGSVGTVCLLALLGAALLRRPVGYVFAWAAQLGGVLLGLLTAMMWLVGGIFLVLFLVSFLLGKQIEQRQA